jgi:hypothetical protein
MNENEKVSSVIQKLLAYAEKLGAYPKYYQNSVRGGVNGSFNEIELRLWVQPQMFVANPEDYNSNELQEVCDAVEDPSLSKEQTISKAADIFQRQLENRYTVSIENAGFDNAYILNDSGEFMASFKNVEAANAVKTALIKTELNAMVKAFSQPYISTDWPKVLNK